MFVPHLGKIIGYFFQQLVTLVAVGSQCDHHDTRQSLITIPGREGQTELKNHRNHFLKNRLVSTALDDGSIIANKRPSKFCLTQFLAEFN